MLKPVPNRVQRHPGGRFAVVASEYNRKHVDGLLDGAVAALREAGAVVEVVRVPGAFEIPVTVECLARDRKARWQGILALGVIIRGETAHADLVGEWVTRALMDISVRHRVPVIHEVLLVGSQRQADVRCLDPRHNRGREAGSTALAMARLLGRLGHHRLGAA